LILNFNLKLNAKFLRYHTIEYVLGKLRALDLVEVNPLLAKNEEDLNKTVFSATRTILSFFGFKTAGTLTPLLEIKRPQ
jgi:hypothetical protein